MKHNYQRGLELSKTERVSDAERFYLAIARGTQDVEKSLVEQIDLEDPYGVAVYAERLKTLAEMWLWAREVYYVYEETPAVLIAVPKYARHIDDYHEDMGPVLWWRDTTEDDPYVGTPHDKGFDDTYKWWSPIDIPEIPESETRE